MIETNLPCCIPTNHYRNVNHGSSTESTMRRLLFETGFQMHFRGTCSLYYIYIFLDYLIQLQVFGEQIVLTKIKKAWLDVSYIMCTDDLMQY